MHGKRYMEAVVLAVVLATTPVWAWQGKVTRVLDGDSVLVHDGTNSHEIRLYGIDAPEYKQPFGREAARIARKILLRKRVRVVQVDTDRYGREVSLLYLGKNLINRELVRKGAAWLYPRYCKRKNICGGIRDAQQWAREHGVGLWALDNPLSPWKWKQRNKWHKK
jgi:endonuclease YncB( thermonuclease family)